MRERIGPYRIEKVIGKGAMGLVYKGRHESLDRCAAIKALMPKTALDATARQRLIHEARAQAHVTHENIVAVYDFIPEDGELFIAMEFVDGETLAALMQRSAHGRLTAADGLPLMLQILSALEHVHREKITHRDIKPSNVLIANGVVKLTDFGIALMADAPRLTAHQHLIGTPEYMSPEQLQGLDVDHRSDVYSAGLVLYAMLAGHPPFPAHEVLPALSQRMEGARDLRRLVPDIPDGIREALGIALQFEREHRFQSAAIFRDTLRDIRAGFLHTAFDPQEDIPTEVLQSGILTVETIAAPAEPPRRSVIPWLVITASLSTAGYVVLQHRTRVPMSPQQTEVQPVRQELKLATPSRVPDEPPSVDTMPEEVFVPATDTVVTAATTPDLESMRMQQVAVLRDACRTAIAQTETALLAERFDDAVQELEVATRAAQTYPDDLREERETIADLRTRLIDARVAVESRKQQDALWQTRLASVEEDLRLERWPEAERFAQQIADDAQAPPAIAERARELLQQAKEGRIAAFRQTRISPTTNSTVRKPSSPPRKKD